MYTLALHPCVYFTNTNLEAIETMRGWLSSGCIVRAKSKGDRYKPTFVLHITGTRNIISLLNRLRPHLIIKRRQGETLVRYCDSRAGHYLGSSRQYTEEELSLYTTLRELNERGVKKQRQHTEA